MLERDLAGTLDLRERDAGGLVVVDLKTSGAAGTQVHPRAPWVQVRPVEGREPVEADHDDTGHSREHSASGPAWRS